MKELRGSATGVTSAPVSRCVQFFRAVEDYPTWHPQVVREVDVLERDGGGEPTRAHAKLHVAAGPVVKDFDLVLAVTAPDARTVKLTRVPNHPGDDERFEVVWHVEEGTRIHLDVEATLSVPRLLPLGGIGDGLAQGFVSAAIKALDA